MFCALNDKTQKVIVIGGGGHAKVVLSLLRELGIEPFGIADPDKLGQSVLGIPVRGGDEWVLGQNRGEVVLVNAIGAAGCQTPRKKIFDTFKEADFSFLKMVHPCACVDEDVLIEEGTQVMAGSVIQAGVKIGSNSIVNTRVSMDHDCTIGKNVHVAPGTTICGGVTINEGTFVGAGSVLVQNVNVGSNCIIGAGSVLLSDVPDDATAYGNPARIVSD